MTALQVALALYEAGFTVTGLGEARMEAIHAQEDVALEVEALEEGRWRVRSTRHPERLGSVDLWNQRDPRSLIELLIGAYGAVERKRRGVEWLTL